MPQKHSRTAPLACISLIIMGAILINSCSPIAEPIFAQSSPSSPSEGTTIEIDRAEITFEVTLPTESSYSVYLDIVDEVVGIPWNPLRLEMIKDGNRDYSLTVPITVGSDIQYRYVLGSSPTQVERTTHGTPVRYRIVHVFDPMVIQDVITAWDALPENLEVGRLVGDIIDSETELPIPDVMITLAGMQTISAVDGSFILEEIPVGTHSLTAYSTTGQYQTFQQGARIANHATTQAKVALSTIKFVDVTFIVSPPADQPVGAPIRIVGNTFSFGNTFANLNGGMSTLASRAPLMQIREDGSYLFTATLPAGLDLRYSYTLGDGFWNDELNSQGRFRVRQLIIPNQDITVEDQIIGWGTEDAPVFSFELKTPPTTPARDVIAIQFAPFGWTEPIPMWPLGDNTWAYRLYSPLQIGGNMEYRYCRNEQCETAAEDRGSISAPQRTLRELPPGKIHDRIDNWSNWSDTDQPTAIAAVKIQPRGADFVTAVGFFGDYHPSWQPYLGAAMDYLSDIHASHVILAPTWSYTSNITPTLELVPGRDMFTADLRQALYWADGKKLNTVLYPQVHFSTAETDWWQGAVRDEEWWNNWFECYTRFLINFADLAEANGVSALILGEPASQPSWPGAALPQGLEGPPPADAELRWTLVIDQVRAHFSGELLWAVPFSDGLNAPTALLSQMDAIYLVWQAPLVDSNSPTQTELTQSFRKLLKKKIKPFHEEINKPIWISLAYPSIDGAARGCVEQGKTCVPLKDYFADNLRGDPDQVDLQEQADIYSAAFAALNEQDWIAGVSSEGFYPPVSLRDGSCSIHGKPAADVIWYWYPLLVAEPR